MGQNVDTPFIMVDLYNCRIDFEVIMNGKDLGFIQIGPA